MHEKPLAEKKSNTYRGKRPPHCPFLELPLAFKSNQLGA